MLTLRLTMGQLTPAEYLSSRLWQPRPSIEQKQAFVGKEARHRMHVAYNDRHWYRAAADKILFRAIMAGAALPVPAVLAIT